MSAYWQVQQVIEEAIGKEAQDIVSGTCVNAESVEATAMNYRERLGYIEGLKKALQIINDVEAGRHG